MKLIAIPLTKPSTVHLVYYLTKTTSTVAPPSASLIQRQLSRATDAAARQWNKLGKAPPDNWRYKTYAMGERFMHRIEFEEWALKAIDPAIAPQVFQGTEQKLEKDLESTTSATPSVELLFPPKLIDGNELLSGLKAQVDSRQPLHKRRMYYSILLMPLTIPVGILPLIPNLPLFYLCWRAWSHWRAWRASQYLSSLIDTSRLLPTPSESLDSILCAPPSNPPSLLTTAESPVHRYQMVLDRMKIKLLVKNFALDDGEVANLNRAMDQAEGRLREEEENKKKK